VQRLLLFISMALIFERVFPTVTGISHRQSLFRHRISNDGPPERLGFLTRVVSRNLLLESPRTDW